MAAPDWDTISLTTGTGNDQHGDMHGRTLKTHKNVLDYGATGDGTTDDTSAIQSAITAAGVSGEGWVFFPPGTYRISSALSLNTSKPVRLTGSLGTNTDISGSWATNSGARIVGSFNSSLVMRTETTNSEFVIEHLGFENAHATGTCVTLNGVNAPGGVRNCYFRGHFGIVFGSNVFNASVHNCFFKLAGGTYSGSIAITAVDHCQIYNADINGFEIGVRARGAGISLVGGRYEVLGTAIAWGGGGTVTSGIISGISMEANDVGIDLIQAEATVVSGCRMDGTVSAPSGSSDVGIRTAECYGVSIIGCRDAGTHSVATYQVQANANRYMLTFISCQGISGFSFADKNEVAVINCIDVSTPISVNKTQVIATASLPAAATAENGRMIIEDGGAGDRNLILYAGGQRFRIDGGAAF